MTNLIKAELLKARGTRTVWMFAAIAVAFCVVWAAVQVLIFKSSAADAYSMAQQGYLFAMILGVLLTAGEYRHQTITWALLVTPRRGRVIMAKLAASGVIGLLLGFAAVVVTAPVTALLLAVRDQPVGTPELPAVLLGSLLSTAMWSVFGAALGLLLRNQVAAIVTAFVWFFYVEWFLVAMAPAIGRWTPTGASKAFAGWSRSGMPVTGDLLPTWGGGLVFLGYAVAAGIAARLISVRRDVT